MRHNRYIGNGVECGADQRPIRCARGCVSGHPLHRKTLVRARRQRRSKCRTHLATSARFPQPMSMGSRNLMRMIVTTNAFVELARCYCVTKTAAPMSSCISFIGAPGICWNRGKAAPRKAPSPAPSAGSRRPKCDWARAPPLSSAINAWRRFPRSCASEARLEQKKNIFLLRYATCGIVDKLEVVRPPHSEVEDVPLQARRGTS
jgi:hypothetical protein